MPDAYCVVLPERKGASLQHHFVGDVGDFGKYGLLRALTGAWPAAEPRLSLGVVWYLPAGPTGSAADGQKLNYLDKPEQFKSCDPHLYDTLGRMVYGGERSLGAVKASGTLGDDTVFVDQPIPKRLPDRRAWFEEAVRAVNRQAVVFLDPDNGLAPPSAGRSSLKHVYLHEVEAFVRLGQTVVVYHHLGRHKPHEDQMREWSGRLRTELDVEPRVLRYGKGTGRVYFIVPADAHAETISERLKRFAQSLWFERRHFTLLLVEPMSPLRGSEMAPSSAALRTLEEGGAPSPTEGGAKLLATGESQIVEFKSTARWNVQAGKRDKQMEHVIVKTVCGFLNAQGGRLLIGVDDDANVVGLAADMQTLGRKADRDGYELFLRQLLDNDLSVPTAGIVRISFETVNSLDICVVSVAPYRRPVFAKPPAGHDSLTEFYVRVGNSTKPLHGNDMLEYQANHWGT